METYINSQRKTTYIKKKRSADKTTTIFKMGSTITLVFFCTFVNILFFIPSKATFFIIEDGKLSEPVLVQPSFPLRKSYSSILFQNEEILGRVKILPPKQKQPVKNNNKDAVLYEGPAGKIYFAQIISLISQGFGNIGNPTTTTTSTSTFYFTCTKSTTACSGRRRRGILEDREEEDVGASFKTLKSDATPLVKTSSGIIGENRTLSIHRSKQQQTLMTRFATDNTTNKRKGVSPSSVQKIEKTATPISTNVNQNDNSTSSTGDSNAKEEVPDLASSLADQLVPLALKGLLAESSTNPLLRHQLDLLRLSAQKSPQQLIGYHDEGENKQLSEGLGRAITVTVVTVTSATTTSTPSCSTTSGFNQC